MVEQPETPKVSSAEASITYTGEVSHVKSTVDAKTAVKSHISHVFDVEHGDIGYIDIVVEQIDPYREGSPSFKGRYSFKAEFELDEGPASYVYDDESEYVVDQLNY